MSKHITLIDFGSTFTKGVIVDTETESIVARSRVLSTVETDVRNGFEDLLNRMGEQLSPEKVADSKKIACSSAAGGLRMVIIGLIPELTLEAGRKTAYNAGAKIVGAFSGELTPQDMQRIADAKPDLILLSGGTDGGNQNVLLFNAEQLAKNDYSCPVIVAGNKNASCRAVDILCNAGRDAILTDNVMPEIGKLNIEPARETIRRLFIERIAIAKGISGIQNQVDLLMPTPDAVLHCVTLIANGTGREEGFGELLAVDVGGATTDVYSVASGAPTEAGTNLKNFLPEPYIKRTVEGDLGMRHNAATIMETVGKRHLTQVAGLPEEQEDSVENYCRTVKPDFVAIEPVHVAIETALAGSAVELAVARHVGVLEIAYLPGVGETCFQTGKDMRTVRFVVGTGGPVIDSRDTKEILQMSTWKANEPLRLRPKNPLFVRDSQYIMYAVGLLAADYPDLALHLAKKYLEIL